MNYLKLSKEIAYALRHHPGQYGLELDNQGYVQIEELLLTLNHTKHYPKEITLEDLQTVIELSDKKRLEIFDGKIRALYGHSIKDQIKKNPSTPPAVLYHGTSHKALRSILAEGLKPMDRQYVHLSIDQETAMLVGKRRDENPVLLSIHTKAVLQAGIQFYLGNDKIWLADSIPAKYIQVTLQ